MFPKKKKTTHVLKEFHIYQYQVNFTLKVVLMKDFTPELSSFLDLLTGIELKSNQHLVINKFSTGTRELSLFLEIECLIFLGFVPLAGEQKQTKIYRLPEGVWF